MLSVILPAPFEEPHLVETLGALVEGVAEGVLRDCVVVGSRSSDLVSRCADAAGADFIVQNGALPDLIRRGATSVRSDWSLVVLAGMVPSGGWIAEAADFLKAGPETSDAAYFPYRGGRGIQGGLQAFFGNRLAAWRGRPHPLQGLIASTGALRAEDRPHLRMTPLDAVMLDRRNVIA